MDHIQETLENLENLSPEEHEEFTRQLAQDYKQLQSSTSKGINLYDQAVAFYKNANGDMDKLAELNETNPEIASIVLKKFYDGNSLEEVQQSQQQKAEESKVSTEVNSILNSYKEQIPEDLREQFDNEFKEFVGQRKLTPDNVEKYIKASLREIGAKVDESVIEEARLASAGGATGKQATTSNNDYLKKQAKDLLDQL